MPDDDAPGRQVEDDRNRLLSRQVRALERLSVLARTVAVAAAVGVVVAGLGEVVMIVFAAALVAVLLRGAGQRLGRLMHVGTGFGLLVVVVGVIAFFGVLGWWHGNSLVQQAGQLQQRLAEQLADLREHMQQTEWGKRLLQDLPFGLGTSDSSPANGEAAGGASLTRLAGLVVGAFWSALGLLGTIGVILVAALYIALAPRSYVDGLVHLLPARRQLPTRRVLTRIGEALWGWLVGQFLDMLIVGVLCGLGLFLLGMPLVFILALIAGVLNFVPYVGAIAGAVPAVLVALSISGQQALLVAALYLGVQTFEGNVTAPLIQQRTIDLPPALTILSQTAFGVVFGILGVILATPFTAAVLAAMQALREEAVRNDP